MTRQSILLTALTLFFLASSFGAQNTPKISLQGIVVQPEREKDSPISKAAIELFDYNRRRVVASASTSADGKFDFQNLERGIYRLTITRSGFVTREIAELVINPNSPPTAQRFLMTPTGTITGRVTGRGQPLVLADVFALKSTYTGGQQTLTVVQSTKTNVRGEYRLFWLSPGRYYVSATGASAESPGTNNVVLQQGGDNASSIYSERLTLRNVLTRAIGNGLGAGETYLPTFFPGTLDAQAATVIDVRSGGEARNMDIEAPPKKTYRVSGVLGGTPLPIDQAAGVNAPVFPYLTLYNLGAILVGTPNGNATNLTIRGFRVGSFDFPSVAPGRYLVHATGGNLSGQATIDVFDRDVRANIDMQPGFDVSGRITVDGPPAAWHSALRVLLRNEISLPRYTSDAPQPNGNFTVSSVMAGNYRLFVNPALRPVADGPAQTPMPLYVKSVRLGDRDVLRDGIEVNAGLEGKLEIVVGIKPASLAGVVNDDAGRRVANATVVLLPEEGLRYRIEHQTAVADSTGKFLIPYVPPGNYKVFAWQEIEKGLWQDPEFMRRFDDDGKTLRLEESERGIIQLNAIKATN